MDRHTPQRIAIEASLRSAQRPLSPSEILDLAKRESPTINLATVYRTLKLLEERILRSQLEFHTHNRVMLALRGSIASHRDK